MVRAFDIAFAAMCLAIVAVMLVEFLDQLPADSGTSTTTSTQHMLPLAATAAVALFAAVALVFRNLRRAGGGGNRRLSEQVTFMFCASAGILQYVFFVQPAGGVINVGARARALGLAAVRTLPASATVTFFLGMTLVLVHVRAGGGVRGGDVAEDGTAVLILSKMALEAAATLVGLMAMALYTTY